MTGERSRARSSSTNFDYEGLEVYDDENDRTYVNAVDEDLIEDEELEVEAVGSEESQSRAGRGRNFQRSRAPSPEETSQATQAGASNVDEPEDLAQHFTEPRASEFCKRDSAGRRRWFIAVGGPGIRSEQFSITEDEMKIKWGLLLDNFCQLDRKVRRLEYNNVFENFWLQYKRRSQNF